MKNNLYTIENLTDFDMHTLSTLDMIKCDNTSQKLFKKLKRSDVNDDKTLHAIADLASLCSYCLYKNNVRAFNSPIKVLKKLTAELICEISQQYFANMTCEQHHNCSFDEQIHSIPLGDAYV